MVDGKQLTIAWHVDDCIASHMDKRVLEEFGKVMIKEFGEMDFTTGDEHDFLGMKIKMNTDKTVTIDRRDKLREAIDLFEEYDNLVDPQTITPAANYLFIVNPNSEQLDQKYSEGFHSIAAKLGYIMKRARPDIETGVSFLMKRVAKSDVDDRKILRRIIGFLKSTLDELRIIGATSLAEIMTLLIPLMLFMKI